MILALSVLLSSLIVNPSYANQNSLPAILFLLDNQPRVIIPNRGSQSEGTDLTVLENGVASGTFVIDFSGQASDGDVLLFQDSNQQTIATLTRSSYDLLFITDSLDPNFGFEFAVFNSPERDSFLLTITRARTIDAGVEFSYTYDPFGTARDHSVGADANIDQLLIVANNLEGESSTPTPLNVFISDIGAEPAPSGAIAIAAAMIQPESGTALATLISSLGKNTLAISGHSDATSNQLDVYTNNTAHKSVAFADLNSNFSNLDGLDGDPDNDFDCLVCLRFQMPENTVNLLDTKTRTTPNYTAHFSRWLNAKAEVDFGFGFQEQTVPSLINGYSEDLTTDFSSITVTARSYADVTATATRTNNNTQGAFEDANIEVNFLTQQITDLTLNLRRNQDQWNVNLSSSVGISQSANTFEVTGVFTGELGAVDDFLDISGEVQLVFLGENADAIMLVYSLSAISNDLSDSVFFRAAEVIGGVILEPQLP